MANLITCVTVDWEGLDLKSENLLAMADFRDEFQQVPLTHFICPAYLTRGGDLHAIAERIAGQVHAGDEVALHVHCWESLIAAAGFAPLITPTWYSEAYNDGNGPEVAYGAGQVDVGHGVPFGVYTAEQVAAIVAFANGLLVDHGIASTTPVSFRCGGWMAADPVFRGLAGAGLRNDSSGTDAPYFAQIAQLLLTFYTILGDWLPRLWGTVEIVDPAYLANTLTLAVNPHGVDGATQPYSIPAGAGAVFEAPDNGVLADYLTEEMILARFEDAWERAADADQVLVCGFHQESATGPNIYLQGTNLPNFSNALRQFLEHHPLAARAGQSPGIVFNTVEGLRKKRAGVAVRLTAPSEAALRRRQQGALIAAELAQPVGRFVG